MDATTIPAAVEVLERAANGSATIADLAEALSSLPELHGFVPRDEVAKLVGDLNDARARREAAVERGDLPEAEAYVRWSDVSGPQISCRMSPEGRPIPRFFTSATAAHAFAVAQGIVALDATIATVARSPLSMIMQALQAESAGIILDDASSHRIELDHGGLLWLVAELTAVRLTELPALHVLVADGQLHLQRTAARIQAFAYDSGEAAVRGLAAQTASSAKLTTVPLQPVDAVRLLLEMGAGELLINAALADQRSYVRHHLLLMARHLNLATPPLSERADLPLPLTLRRALARPTLPPVPKPDITDELSRRTFREARFRIDDGSIEPWEMLELLARGTNVWVPVHAQDVEGLHWPQFFRHPEKEGATIAQIFTREAGATARLAQSRPESQRAIALSGIEAMRWIWAMPAAIDDISVDYPDEGGWLIMPRFWAMSIIFPLMHEFDPTKLAEVPLRGIGNMLGAHGLKPEVMRALAGGWRQLIGPAPESVTAPMVLGEGSYLAVFTAEDRRQAASGKVPRAALDRLATPTESPFIPWLGRVAKAGLNGVIVDPGTDAALVLGPSALLAIGLLSRHLGRRAEHAELLAETAVLQSRGGLTPAAAGTIAADLPRYFIGVAPAPDGKVNLMAVPGGKAMALFSTFERATEYIATHVARGSLPEATKATPVLAQWTCSALLIAQTEFGEAWIDPVAYQPGGLHLDPVALSAAVERLDDQLKPRVPGFVIPPPKPRPAG